MPNDFAASAAWYDAILGKEEYEKNAKFVAQELKKYKVKSILELACGSGLYLFPLQKAGFVVEGLDISNEMLAVAKKRSKTIKLYQQDMTLFRIKKKYDAILILNSGLVLLPNHAAIEKAIAQSGKHLKDNGLLLIDLPNHAKEMQDARSTQERFRIPKGTIDVTFNYYKKKNKWVEEWKGVVKEKNKTIPFTERYEELIYSPKKLEEILQKHGFTILKVFGSRRGGAFNPNTSWRRVYLCQK